MSDVHPQALEIEDFLRLNPEATVDQISDETGLSHNEVVEILDTHSVTDEGTVELNGPGMGGGWFPARQAEEARRQEMIALIDSQIEERQAVLDNLKDDADPNVTQSIRTMIDDLHVRRSEITGDQV